MAWDLPHQEATEGRRARQTCEASEGMDLTDLVPFGEEEGGRS